MIYIGDNCHNYMADSLAVVGRHSIAHNLAVVHNRSAVYSLAAGSHSVVHSLAHNLAAGSHSIAHTADRYRDRRAVAEHSHYRDCKD